MILDDSLSGVSWRMNWYKRQPTPTTQSIQVYKSKIYLAIMAKKTYSFNFSFI